MHSLAEALADLRAAFTSRGIGWYVIGAQAVLVRGAARTTQDLDLTVDATRVSPLEIEGALVAAGFAHRHPGLRDELRENGRVLVMRHRSGLDVDITLGGPGLEELFLDRASVETLGGVEVPVASATDLVVMKILSGRGKDLDDVRAVLATGRVDLEAARDLLGQLEAALGQSDLLPELESAIADVRGG